MPINYLGKREERRPLVQAGTTWVARTGSNGKVRKTAAGPIKIIRVARVEGEDWRQWRVYTEDTVAQPGKSRPASMSTEALLVNYRREDEMFREAPKPAPRATTQERLPLEADGGRLAELVARVSRLEAYCRRLGDFD
jgi:hypothetical protein